MTFDRIRPALIRRWLTTFALLLFVAAPAFAQTTPTVVGTQGYINGTPLNAHTTAPFDSRNATTLIAFVSSHPNWNGLPVSISGVSDNVGNTWHVLTGPTTWAGDTFTLMSAIYYVEAPVTGASHTVTATLTNGAPLVMHVVAAAGTDPTLLPVYSPIVGPANGPTADVQTPSISVPQNTLLYAWAKNENTANADALDSYQLDPESTSFLWAEFALSASAGNYSGHFEYSTDIGWQTAIVGLRPQLRPVAFNQSVTTFQNTSANITLTASSPNNFPLTYTIVTPPAHGTLSGVAPNVTYAPTAGYIGADTFTFKANDGTGDSNVATVSITVRAPNRAPVANASTVTATSGVASPVTLSATDPDGDPLTYAIVTAPAHGTLTGSGSSRTYTSANGYVGSDVFTFKANDGLADSNVAQVTINVVAQPPTASLVRTRGYINGNPLATHTAAAFDSRNASTLVVYVSTHPVWNGLQVSVSSVTDNLGNTWQLLTGPTTWTGPTFTLMSSIYYVNAPATSANHTVTVRLTNAAPLVLNVAAASGTTTATPPIYSPILSSTNGPNQDVVSSSITAPIGSLLYAWVKNENSANATALGGYTLDTESTSFLWAEYGTAGSTGSYAGHFFYDQLIGWQTAIVALSPPTGPVAQDQSVTTTQNTPVNITLVGSSPSQRPLTYTVLTTPAHGALTGTAPNVTYTPSTGYTGQDAFTFKVNDGTTDSNVATVSITVRPVNRAPVASNGSATVEAGSSVPITLTATDADGDPLTYAVVTGPAHGALTGTAPNLSYTPTGGYAGSDSFTFKANDGLVDSNTATVTISVTTVPPSISSFTPTTGNSGTAVTIFGTGLLTANQVVFNTTAQPTFTTSQATVSSNSTTNAGPMNAAIGDLDGDGKADIAVANHGYYNNIGNTISVFRNLSTPGTTALAPKVDLVSTNGPHDMAIADFDGDGKLDLVMPNYGAFASGNTISVIRNTSTVGNLSFANHVDFTTNAGPPSLAVGDMDGDGKPDVVVTSFNDGSGNSVSVLRNTSTPGQVSFAPKVDLATAVGPYGVAVGDLDGDGKLDIVVSIFGTFAGDGSVVTVFRNTSTAGALSFAPAVNLTVSDGPRESAIGDVDGDGKPDIVVANYGGNGSNNRVSVLRNQSTSGNLSFAPEVEFLTNQGPIRIKLKDVTRDGKLDVITSDYDNGAGTTISVLRNTSTAGTISFAPFVDYQTGLGPHGLAVGDVDGDGANDLVSTDYGDLQGSGNTITVIRLSGDSKITTTVPAGASSGPITVVNPAGSTTSSSSFTVTGSGAPTVTGISPNLGSTAGGTSVTITGTNFVTGATVTIGGTAATGVTVTSATSITAITPAHAAGAVNVTVTNPGGLSGTRTSGFTYVAPPTVTGISPTAGTTAGGTNVTITGTNFAAGATVTIGGTAATNVTVASATSITATTPAHAAGAVNVTVTNSNGLSGTLTAGFTYGTPPTVTGISPNTGSTAGGTNVTITGTNFATGATVTIGGTAATNVTVASATSITATTPAHAAGTANVTVTNPGGLSATSTGAFTYVAPPTVTAISPTAGTTAGGTNVTITGTNFATGATVTIGGPAATNVTVTSATSITATTPAHAAGAVNVTVTNPNGLSGTRTGGFTYGTPPTVTGISPTGGSTAGGTTVTITGTDFATGATVRIGGTAATNVTVASATSITARTPAHAAGTVDVTVTNSNGLSGTLTGGFVYTSPPTVTGVSPNFGPTGGGTNVTITGTNFATGSTVTFGGTAATNVTVASATSITATTPAHAAGIVNVVVTNPNGMSGTLTSGFTYGIRFIQVAAATPQSAVATVSVAYPAAQIAGDLNIVVVGWDDTTSDVQSLGDTRGNVYRLAIGPTTGTGRRQSIFYASPIAAGTNTVTITFTKSTAFPDVRVLQYRGATTLAAVAGASGTGTAANSGSATVASGNYLIFGANTVATLTSAAGANFTSRIITNPNGDIAEDRVVAAAGTYSATATLGSSGAWVMQMAIFK